jgi:hypothetical protein
MHRFRVVASLISLTACGLLGADDFDAADGTGTVWEAQRPFDDTTFTVSGSPHRITSGLLVEHVTLEAEACALVLPPPPTPRQWTS